MGLTSKLRLRTFGELTLVRTDTSGTQANGRNGAQRRSLTLLAVIALHRAGVSRERVMSILWPESDDESARNALRQAVYATRRETGIDDIILGTTELRLNPEVISSDVDEFETALEEGDLDRAATLYRGPFLDGVHVRNSPEFERWAESQRSRLATEYRTALERLARDATRTENHTNAIKWWSQLAAADPLSSRIAVELMEALASAGDSASALAHFRIHEAATHTELGSAPDKSVISVADRLRASSAPITQRQVKRSPSAASRAVAEVDATPLGAAPATDTTSIAPRRSPRFRNAAMIALPILVIAMGLAVAATMRASRADEPRRVVIAPFENRTGDPSLDPIGMMTADWVIDGISRTGLIHIVDPATAFFAARDARAERAETRGIPSIAKALSEATGASIVVTGDYYRKGGTIEFHGRITDASNDRVISTIEPVAIRFDSAINGVEIVRQRVTGLLAHAFDARISDVVDSQTRPPTFAAYQEYVAGLREFMMGAGGDAGTCPAPTRSSVAPPPAPVVVNPQATAAPCRSEPEPFIGYERAATHFRRAFEMDTTFVSALFWTSHALSNAQKYEEASVLLDSITPKRDRLSPLERFGLDALRWRDRGATDSSISAAIAAARLAPRSQWVWNAAYWALPDNRPRTTIALLESVDPDKGWWKGWPQYWGTLAMAKHMIGDYRGESAVIARGLQRYPASNMIRQGEIRNLIARKQVSTAMQKAREMIVAEEPEMPTAVSLTVFELRQHGYLKEGDRLIDDLRPWYQAKGSLKPQGQWGFGRVLMRGERWKELGPHFRPLVEKYPDNPVAKTYVGISAAALGDTATALRIYETLKSLGNDPNALFGRAGIAGRLGRREETVELLKRTWALGHSKTGTAHPPRDNLNFIRGYPPFEELVKERR